MAASLKCEAILEGRTDESVLRHDKMKPLTVTVSIPAEAFSSQITSAEEITEGPDSQVPELQVLDHYAGRWESEIAGRPQLRRTEVAEWILNGRFLRQCWSTEGFEDMPRASGITLMTFDPARNTYLSWSFLAIGSVVHNEGTWEADSRTMTWRDNLSGTGESVVTKACFAEDLTNVWQITEQDAEGRIVREVDGRNVRRSW